MACAMPSQNTLSAVDCLKATAYDKRDEQMIFAAIESTSFKAGGLNEAVTGRLRQWLEESSLRVLQNTAGPEKLKLQMKVAGFLHEQGEPFCEHLPPATASCRTSGDREVRPHIEIISGTGKEEEADRLYKQLLADQIATLGRSHPDTLATRHNYSINLEAQGKRNANFMAFPGPRLRLSSAARVSAWHRHCCAIFVPSLPAIFRPL